MKLALVIGSLGGGGAERVMSVLANAWAQRGEDITLITVKDAKGDRYSVDPNIRRIGLGLTRSSRHWGQALWNNVMRVRALRSVLRDVKPDAVLSFLTPTNVLAILAAWPLHTPVIVAEHISPERRFPMAWRYMRIVSYRRATAVVSLTERGDTWIRSRIRKVPSCVIPNPVQVPHEQAPDAVACEVIDACADRQVIITMGRLVYQKGHDLLLQAFAEITPNHPDWCLLIVGEGSERGRLEELARKLDIADRVLLPGFTRTPYELLRRAEVFVLSSHYEGFPMALLEAMACGLPCVSADCPTGPAELIEHERNGLLVPPENVEALAQAIAGLMHDASQRQQLGFAARATAGMYSLDVILAQWQRLFETCGMDTRGGAGPK